MIDSICGNEISICSAVSSLKSNVIFFQVSLSKASKYLSYNENLVIR